MRELGTIFLFQLLAKSAICIGKSKEADRPCAASVPKNESDPQGHHWRPFLSLFHFAARRNYGGEGFKRVEQGISQAVGYVKTHFDFAWRVCPSAAALAELLHQEDLLLCMLPISSIDTPSSIFNTTFENYYPLLAGLLQMGARHPYDEEGCRRLAMMARRANHFIASINNARSEEWLTNQRTWMLDKYVWDNYRRVCKTVAIVFAPAPVDAQENLENRRPYWGRDEFQVMLAWRELAKVIPEVVGTDVEWWPIGGTLIGFLRYGRIHGHLSEGKVDQVDIDLDLVIVLPSARQWFETCVSLNSRLTQLGWHGCMHVVEGKSPNDTRNEALNGADIRGRASFSCFKVTDYTNMVSMSIVWARPVEVLDQFIAPLGSRKRRLVRPVVAASSMTPISDELQCDSSGDCWSTSKLFGSWLESLLSSDLRLPMARCEAWGSAAPCPREASRIAANLFSGEYWQPEGASQRKWPCIALPDIACSKKINVDRIATNERNIRLHTEGLTRADLKILYSRRGELRRAGFQAHNFSGCDIRPCMRHSSKGVMSL